MPMEEMPGDIPPGDVPEEKTPGNETDGVERSMVENTADNVKKIMDMFLESEICHEWEGVIMTVRIKIAMMMRRINIAY